MVMYRDWGLLRDVGEALGGVTGERPLPNTRLTDLRDVTAEATQWGIKLPDPTRAKEAQVKILNSQLSRHRAKLVSDVMKCTAPLPDIWKQLSERLEVDADPFDQRYLPEGHPLGKRWPEELRIRNYFATSPFYRAAPADKKLDIRSDVTTKLWFVVIRNAEKWYLQGNHHTEWWGYVCRQMPALIRRACGVFP